MKLQRRYFSIICFPFSFKLSDFVGFLIKLLLFCCCHVKKKSGSHQIVSSYKLGLNLKLSFALEDLFNLTEECLCSKMCTLKTKLK